MKDFINEESVVQDEFYKIFKDSIICPLCLDILIDPVMCMKCQNVYCKSCTNDWLKKDNKCPNRCNEPNYQQCKGKMEILSKLKFKCKECHQIFKYNECEKHKEVCSEILKEFEVIDANSIKTLSTNKIKKLTEEELNKIQKHGNKMTYISSKKNILLFKYSNNIRKFLCW